MSVSSVPNEEHESTLQIRRLSRHNSAPSPSKSPSFVKDSQDNPDGANAIDPSYTPKILKTSGVSIDHDVVGDREHERTVMVLYSGGTIGMRVNSDGGK